MIEKLRKALYLAETASAREVRAAVYRMIDESMSPEEKQIDRVNTLARSMTELEATVRDLAAEIEGLKKSLKPARVELPSPQEKEDPRRQLVELAERRAQERGVPLRIALEDVKRDNVELTEAVGLLYGPPKRRPSSPSSEVTRDSDADPREVLSGKALKLADEKGITLAEALEKVKAAEPALVEDIELIRRRIA